MCEFPTFKVPLTSVSREKQTTCGSDGRRSGQASRVALSDPRGGASPWLHPAWALGRVRVQFRCKVCGARPAVAPRSSVSAMHNEWAGASSPNARTPSRPGPGGGGSRGSMCLYPLGRTDTLPGRPGLGIRSSGAARLCPSAGEDVGRGILSISLVVSCF